mmetsp:Transcript_123251/g.348256  ORF Transcript_123251/g.348256 Transcript_123251/m.348256 type:complete len:213 (-) Transcript_123251:32-670(-)
MGWFATRLAKAPHAHICTCASAGNCRIAQTTCSTLPCDEATDCSSERPTTALAITSHAASWTAASIACRRMAAVTASTTPRASASSKAWPHVGRKPANARHAVACSEASARCRPMNSRTSPQPAEAAGSGPASSMGFARPASTWHTRAATGRLDGAPEAAAPLQWPKGRAQPSAACAAYSSDARGTCRSIIWWLTLSYLSTRTTTGSIAMAP